MHPHRLRCSSLKYSRYSRSSRLAGGAPRPSRCDARLSPRAAKVMTMPLSRFQPVLLSILRMIAAFVFLAHGTQKLFAYPSNGSTHRVAIASLLGAAGVVETIGGSLMLLGLFARP